MEEWLLYFHRLYPMSDELSMSLMRMMRKEVYRKNKTLLREGQLCDWIGFIEAGLLKTCIDVPKVGERILQFYTSGEPVFLVSALNEKPIYPFSLVSVQETILRKIYYQEIQFLCEKYPIFNFHIRKLIEYSLVSLERNYIMHFSAPKDRLSYLSQSKSRLLEKGQIPDYMIAAHLNIDKATLSRYRHGKQ